MGLWDADSHGMLEYVACFSSCIDDKNVTGGECDVRIDGSVFGKE